MGLIPAIQGWFNIWKSINVNYYVNQIKRKKNMTISIDIGKALHRIQRSFIIKKKTLSEFEIKENIST